MEMGNNDMTEYGKNETEGKQRISDEKNSEGIRKMMITAKDKVIEMQRRKRRGVLKTIKQSTNTP